MKNLKTKIHNFFFCLKYPFWKSHNVWTGKFLGYEFTWYDDIPQGWRIAFGKQLSDDIKAAYKKDKKANPKLKWADALMWTQIKEKWGRLCLYATATSNIYAVLEHYEELSEKYCIACGAPAEYQTSGWIIPLCERCFENTSAAKAVRENFPKQYKSFKKKHLISEIIKKQQRKEAKLKEQLTEQSNK